MAEKERIEKQFDFIREIDKEKFIGRQTYLSDARRKENDAEHAWHMAIMTVLLSEYSNEEIDVLKTVTMLLIHDLVEIDAGDTYAYDEEGSRFRALWDEFEARETAEAKFAHAMDHVQPLMLNAATEGKSWIEHGVRLSQVLKRNQSTGDGSEELWEYAYENFISPNLEKGRIEKD